MSGSDPGLELNKIVASILIASLIVMIVGIVANALYKPKIEIVDRGYQVPVSEDGPGVTSAEEVEVDIEALMASANAESGAKTIKKCIACHSFDEGGANKVGPNLWKIVNAGKGKRPGFEYSKVMAAAGGVWDHQSLFNFLKKPGKYLPGTKMSFAGINNPEDIANVIAYLRERAG